MNGEPHLSLKAQRVFEYAYQIGVALAHGHKARADSRPRTQCCELPDRTVTPESELLTREPHRRSARRIDEVRIAIKSDQAVSRDIFWSFRETECLHIPPMREQTD